MYRRVYIGRMKNSAPPIADRIAPSSGFTLIEMLVVIAIIALVASLTVPVVSGALARGRKTSAMSNLRQLGIGIMAYAADNSGRFPEGGFTPLRWHDQIYPYVGNNPNVFRDPAGNRDLGTWVVFAEDGEDLPFDFGYNAHLNVPVGHPLNNNPNNRGPRGMSEIFSHQVPLLHTIYSQNNFVFWTFDLPENSGHRQSYDPRHGGRGIVLWSDSSVSSPTYAEYMRMAEESGGGRAFVTGRR